MTCSGDVSQACGPRDALAAMPLEALAPLFRRNKCNVAALGPGELLRRRCSRA